MTVEYFKIHPPYSSCLLPLFICYKRMGTGLWTQVLQIRSGPEGSSRRKILVGHAWPVPYP